MKRFLITATVALAGLAFAVVLAPAQMTYPYRSPAYGPFYQPSLSPYLNFLRGGDPSANYFLGVVPEMQRRTNARTFSSALANLQEGELEQAVIDTGIVNQLPSAGHPTVFNNTGRYFNTYGNAIPTSRGRGFMPPMGGSGMRSMGMMGGGMGMMGGGMGMMGGRGMSIMPPSTGGR
jgi:hypothetical protein